MFYVTYANRTKNDWNIRMASNIAKLQRKLNKSFKSRNKAVKNSPYSSRYNPKGINTIVVIGNKSEMRDKT